ncbi:hypothetical protein FRUB_07221 [Fimbriiglobus ruber]|uniref:Uncharacterized protein n=1 Tax=Fimbriiglobus ruber TaxID=1908690 RepID=A0A225D963_9BACT|nr:hypothetical protein FRUB_07221 [Fimbriiglobus ruber]
MPNRAMVIVLARRSANFTHRIATARAPGTTRTIGQPGWVLRLRRVEGRSSA